MGVDFYECDVCEQSFADCNKYASCGDCGGNLCEFCAKRYGVMFAMANLNDLTDEEKGEVGECECPFCSGKILTDNILLNFALSLLKLTKEELGEKYLEQG